MRIFILLFLLLPLNLEAYEAAVVSAHPAATQIGADILKKGGNASDAAVATAFALAVVEPHNSGLGGGGFALYYDAAKADSAGGGFSFLDYRESAPGAIGSVKREDLETGIRSVGVPGFIKGLEEFHRKNGKLSWAEVVEPSLALARDGFPLAGKLKDKILEERAKLEKDALLKQIFVDALDKGKIVQADLAATLTQIAADGSAPFYKGGIAREISAFMKKEKGVLTAGDIGSYSAYWRKPFEFEKGAYRIVSAPIPSAGGQALSLLFKKAIIYKVDRHMPYSPEAYARLVDAYKDYFYFRSVGLADSTYNIIAHTTHLCVIDKDGNMVSMSNTLHSPFGAGVMVPGTGIILNNELDDFSDSASPNRPTARKRPLSSMSPTIVFKNKQPHLIIGTPGGLTIPLNLFQILHGTWDWKSPLGASIARKKLYYSPHTQKIFAEEGFSKRVLKTLSPDEEVEIKPSIGNVQAIVIQNAHTTVTYSDPRGEGKGLTVAEPKEKKADPEKKVRFKKVPLKTADKE